MPDTTLTSAEQVIAGVQAAYDRVKLWPEDRMRPSAVEELGPGFTDLLLLRNLVPDLLSLARAGIEAGKAEESMREPRAWEGWWSGAGSVDSFTRVTRLRSTMEEWKAEGAEITPLFAIHALPLTGASHDQARD